MRISSTLGLALACAAVTFFPACSGGTQATPAGSEGLGATRSVYGSAFGVDHGPTRHPKRLAVGLFTSVDVLNKGYKTIQTITDGVSSAADLFYDSNANLYVANQYGPDVVEINKKGKLVFTYATGQTYPASVAVDQSGNVYVSDWGNDSASVVLEYTQRSSVPIVSCSTGYANSGIALDGHGNVFVSAVTPGTTSSVLLEYTGGLSGCKATTLGLTIDDYVGDLLVDKHGNLLVCEYTKGVDVIPPPYTSISKTFAGAPLSLNLALNKAQTLLYIPNTNNTSPAVVVDKYPSGKLVTTIPFSNTGMSIPSSIAVYPN